MKSPLPTLVVFALLCGLASPALSGQSATGLLQQFRTANARLGLPKDVTLTGTVRDHTGKTQSVEILIKGKDKMRFTAGAGKEQRITIYNRNEGWIVVDKKIQALQEHSSVRRPTIIPALDLLVEMDSPKLIANDQGFKSIGPQSVRHVMLSLPDPASKRSFGRKLDENLDVYFDPATMLVVRTQRLRRAEENMDYQVPSIMEFSDYRMVENVAVPFRIVNTIGNSQSTLTLISVVFNRNLQNSVFTPAGGVQ